MPKEKERLDKRLVASGLVATRERARALILEGGWRWRAEGSTSRARG